METTRKQMVGGRTPQSSMINLSLEGVLSGSGRLDLRLEPQIKSRKKPTRKSLIRSHPQVLFPQCPFANLNGRMITNSLFYYVFFSPLSRSNGGGGKIYCHGLGDDQCLLSSLLDGIKSTQPEADMTSLLFIISEFLSRFSMVTNNLFPQQISWQRFNPMFSS